MAYADNPRSLKFVSFVDRDQSSVVTRIKFSIHFIRVETTQEYDFAIIDVEERLGDTLGYLGLLANARSEDFDIQTAMKPIIMLGLNSTNVIEF